MISLFFNLMVGSEAMALYVCLFQQVFSLLFVILCVHYQPKPPLYLLSVPSWKGLSSALSRLFLSPLVILSFGFWIFCMVTLTCTLNSSALPSPSFVHACSTAAIYCMMGGFLGTTTKFGPWANSFSSALESGLSEILITHLFVVLLDVPMNITMVATLV